MLPASLTNRLAVGLLLLAFIASIWHVFFNKARPEAPGVAEFTVELNLGHWLLHTGMREAFAEAMTDYQKLRPEVHLRQTPVPIRLYPVWLRTQLVGGTAPDIAGILGLNEELINRYYLPLTPWLDKPNPYNAGTELEDVPWGDTFFDGLSGIRGLTATTGEILGVVIQTNSMQLYYNRDMLIEITGSDTPPREFNDLRILAEKVADYNARHGTRIWAISGCGPYATYAFDRIVPSQTQRLVLEHSPNRNLALGALDFATMLLDGTFSYSRTPELRSALELMRETSLLFNPGFIQLQRDEAIAAYVQQRSLMLIAGSWDYAALIDGVPFETRALPVLGPSTSDPQFGEFTLGARAETPGFEGSMGITRTSKNPEAALDFLYYLTSQRAAEKFSQTSQRISAIIGARMPQSLEQIQPQLVGEIPGFPINLSFSAGNSANVFLRHMHKAIGPRAEIDELVHALDSELPRYLRDDIATYLRNRSNDIRHLDTTILMHYTLPAGHPARARWLRHSESQHLRQLEYQRYREAGGLSR